MSRMRLHRGFRQEWKSRLPQLCPTTLLLKRFYYQLFLLQESLQMITLLEALAALVPHVTHAAVHLSVTEYLCSPSQRCHPMLDQGQGQDQAHSQPLDLSLQSSASTTSYLMESHKLEEKRFSSKIGEWVKLLTKRASSEGICESFPPKSRNLLSGTMSTLYFVYSEMGKCPNQLQREMEMVPFRSSPKSLNNSIMWLMAAIITHQGHWWLG